jgi:hypothetical protein
VRDERPRSRSDLRTVSVIEIGRLDDVAEGIAPQSLLESQREQLNRAAGDAAIAEVPAPSPPRALGAVMEQ